MLAYFFLWDKAHALRNESCFPSTQLLEPLFLAPLVNTFPPVFESDWNYLTATRYIDKLIFRKHLYKNMSKEVLCIQKREMESLKIGVNMFVCPDGSYVSALFVCDGFF